MFEEGRVSQDCRNAGNPAHRCSDYCYTVIAEAQKRKEESATQKLRIIPGILDRQKMLLCLSKREVNSPKDRVSKRNKAVADRGSDTTAIEAKKPKSQGGKSVTSILADVTLDENERSQGCIGEDPYRLDSLKAFQNKMDLDRYAKMEDWEFEELLRVQAGALMCSLDTLKNFQIHMDPDRYAKMEDWKFEEQLRVQTGALMSSLAAMKVRQNAAKKQNDLLNAEVEELKETVELWKKELSTTRSELEQKRNELSQANSKQDQLQREVSLLNAQMSDYRAKTCRLFKLEKQLSEVPSYTHHVNRFLKTKAFNTIVNKYSAQSFKMGYEACASVIEEAQAFDSSKHGWDAYLAVEMEKMEIAERESVQDGEGSESQNAEPKAPEEDEIPLQELFLKNDIELQGERYEAMEDIEAGYEFIRRCARH